MKRKFLLVDDDRIANIINKKVLEKFYPNHGILQFTSGYEAITHLAEDSSDGVEIIIFLDINMPEMNGWEFLDRLSSDFPKITPIVYILSSSIDWKDRKKAEDYATDGFIIKPLDGEKINKLSLS
ncbi:MAG: response regulator [Salegentibacter sp.]